MKLIAETAWHHDGDMLFFSKLIEDIAKKSSADYIKFHISLDIDEYMARDHGQYQFTKEKMFSKSEWQHFFSIALDKGKKLMLLVNDKMAVDFANQYAPDLIEIHSVCLNDTTLLNHLKNNLHTNSKIVLGIGGSSLYEIEKAIGLLNTDKIVLMHGFQNYPTKYEDINLKKINHIKQLYPCLEHGYADHTAWENENNVLITLFGAAQGMSYVEKHVTNSFGVQRLDFNAAISIDMFNELAEKLRLLNICNGDGQLALNSGEKIYSNFGPNKKAAILNRDLKIGDKLVESVFAFKRTGQTTNLSQIEILEYIGYPVNKDLPEGHCLTHEDFEDKKNS